MVGRRMAQPLYPQFRKYPVRPALTLGASSCHSMASSIGFSDPTCMLVCAAEFFSGGRRYFPVSNACKPWKVGAS